MESSKYRNAVRGGGIKVALEDWTELITESGMKAFWPSWAYGQYIKESNIAAQAKRARLGNRKIADIKEKVINRHGKNVRILFNRKNGAIIPTKGLSTANAARLDKRNKRAAKQCLYFAERNHLEAITTALKMPRDIRRTLCRKLRLAWGTLTSGGYREAEAMIREG
jgi:hypothetical protein